MRYFSIFIFVTLSGCIELEETASSKINVDNQVLLSWTTPSRLEDEAPLEDEISAYYIHWGESEDNLSNTEYVKATGNDLTLSGLPAGNYYFSVSAETTSGDRSLPSNIVNKTFN